MSQPLSVLMGGEDNPTFCSSHKPLLGPKISIHSTIFSVEKSKESKYCPQITFSMRCIKRYFPSIFSGKIAASLSATKGGVTTNDFDQFHLFAKKSSLIIEVVATRGVMPS